MTPKDETVRSFLDRLEELEDQAALADTRHSDERDELRLLLANNARQRLAQQTQLVCSPDERRAALALDTDACEWPHCLPSRHRLGFPFRQNRSRRLVLDRALRRTVRLLVNKDCVDGSTRLEASCRVDDVTGRNRLTRFRARAEGDEGLSGGDADPHFSLSLFRESVANSDGGTHGPLRIVLVGDRRAEHCHHSVADELLDRAAEAFELGLEADVVWPQDRAHLLWIELLGSRGEPDEIGKDDRHDLALLLRRLRDLGERRCAGVTEASPARILFPATRTPQHG